MKSLAEGVRFGNREKALVEQNFDRFGIGIEFEFHMNEGDFISFADGSVELPSSVQRNLLRDVEEEHANQVEVVTKTVKPATGIELIKDMFGFITKNGYTSDSSGMHISVSIDGDVNLMKFLILMEMGYIIDNVFPEREHVYDIEEQFNGYVERLLSNLLLLNKIDHTDTNKDILDKITNYLSNSALFHNKTQSIKFGDYNVLDGRIELRFFGDENYEDRYDEIEHHLYRSLYILLVSSSDIYHKEYMRGLYKRVFSVLDDNSNNAAAALKISKLYANGKIKTFKDYDKAVQKLSKLSGYELNTDEIDTLARVNNVTVLLNLEHDNARELTSDEWDELEHTINDMRK